MNREKKEKQRKLISDLCRKACDKAWYSYLVEMYDATYYSWNSANNAMDDCGHLATRFEYFEQLGRDYWKNYNYELGYSTGLD